MLRFLRNGGPKRWHRSQSGPAGGGNLGPCGFPACGGRFIKIRSTCTRKLMRDVAGLLGGGRGDVANVAC